MPPVVTSGLPFVFGPDSVITINDVELNCVVNKVSLKADTATVDSTTLCTVTSHPGITKWTFGGTLYQSFQANGAYDVLQAAALAGVPVPFTVAFSKAAPAEGAPQFAGMAIPVPASIVDSEAGALVEVEFEWGMNSAPTEDYGTGPQPLGTHGSAATGGASQQTLSSSAPSSSTPAAA